MRRRDFVRLSSLSALQLYVLACTARRSPRAEPAAPPQSPTGIGPLIDAGHGLLDLPEGFTYVIVQRALDPMSDGYAVPYQPDGMACFLDAQGRYVLLRNHELGDRAFLARYGLDQSPEGLRRPKRAYNGQMFGGVTRVLVDPGQLRRELASSKSALSAAVLTSHWVLAGTKKNCAGGVFDGGWVSCEETDQAGHGYAFLTRPTDEGVRTPRRLDSWGRFRREAIVHDPDTGVVYMTEDHAKSCFYRFVPDDGAQPTGRGVVQALKVDGVPDSSPYGRDGGATRRWANGTRWPATWVTIADPQAGSRPCRDQAQEAGATRFNRLEGVCQSGRSVWFSASVGGAAAAGQIFEYVPSGQPDGSGELVLRYEVTDRSVLSCPDNLVTTPWGDILLAEDNYNADAGCTHQHLRLMDAGGAITDLARNRHHFLERKSAGAEFTGACFSPDGRVLFVNLQAPEHVTVAITGPWPKA
ncbi:MAG: alkaline phosphatase PhoX [Myxococcota bacterium]|nr:alkaline phosphatase PhoX [Myxococcota bacterium]